MGILDAECVCQNDWGWCLVEGHDPDPLECINGPEQCRGEVEYRMPLSGTGKSFPRCEYHWEQRLDREAEINERYPVNPPSDWSPLDAGEAWGENDY